MEPVEPVDPVALEPLPWVQTRMVPQVPHRFHTGSTQVPHRFHTGSAQVPHRFLGFNQATGSTGSRQVPWVQPRYGSTGSTQVPWVQPSTGSTGSRQVPWVQPRYGSTGSTQVPWVQPSTGCTGSRQVPWVQPRHWFHSFQTGSLSTGSRQVFGFNTPLVPQLLDRFLEFNHAPGSTGSTQVPWVQQCHGFLGFNRGTVGIVECVNFGNCPNYVLLNAPLRRTMLKWAGIRF